MDPRVRAWATMAGTTLARAVRRPVVSGAAALAVLLALPVVGAATAGRAFETRLTGDVRQAQADLLQGQDLLEDAYRKQDAALAGRASAAFTRSRDRLRTVAGRVQPLQVAGRAPFPPPVTARVATLDAVIDMGMHVGAAGIAASQALVASGIAPAPGAAPRPQAELVGLLGTVRDEVVAARRAAQAADPSVLPSGDRHAIVRAIALLNTAADALEAIWPSLHAVLDLLGMDGTRTYLIEQVNPAELRSGGGFIGTVSLVHADRGRVTLDRSLPVEAFDLCDAAACVHPRPRPWQPGYVAPPAELAGPPLPEQSRLPAWSLEDSGFAPDFASNARLAESFTSQLLGVHVSGVIAVDFYAVAPLLDLTGPISLPEYKLTLTAGNFVDTVVGLDLARDPAHKDVIAAAAAQIVAALSHLSPADLSRLARIVQDQVRGRHLQVHFENEDVQRQAARLGASDVVNPAGAADFLLETEDNYGGSKANFFIDRTFRLELSRSGSRLAHRLTVDLHDGAPPDKEFIGPHYTAYLRITVPEGASEPQVTSAPTSEYPPIQAAARRSQVPPPGTRVAGGWIFLQVGDGYSGNQRVTFTWDTPWSPSLYWQKQPGTVRDGLTVTWSPGGGHTFSATSQLDGDRVVRLRDNGVSIAAA
jgi:Protein of unknown function (DUF4012)